MTIRAEIYKAIDRERVYQDEEWGGSDHDDEHSLADWICILRKHVEKPVAPPDPGEDLPPPHLQLADEVSVPDEALFNRQMVRIAALAVAALESNGRDAVRDMVRRA